MKKSNLLNLIRFHVEKNEDAFRSEAFQIAKEFDASGDKELADYVLSLVSDVNAFVPQELDHNFKYFIDIETSVDTLMLPEEISKDITGVINCVAHNTGMHKFLFWGSPGTGKTQSVKHICRILRRRLFSVDYSMLVDSRLGETVKNIYSLFNEMEKFPYPENVIFLFDEIDSLVLDRVNNNDVREMGRATSAFFQCMDRLPENIILFATTNLKDDIDRALIRRFDAVVDFDRYKKEDLIGISENILDQQIKRFKFPSRNIRLFRRILNNLEKIPYPGELQNLIRTSLAFSNPDDENDYLRRLYKQLFPDKSLDNIEELSSYNYTIREISSLSGISKSSVSRHLGGEGDE